MLNKTRKINGKQKNEILCVISSLEVVTQKKNERRYLKMGSQRKTEEERRRTKKIRIIRNKIKLTEKKRK